MPHQCDFRSCRGDDVASEYSPDALCFGADCCRCKGSQPTSREGAGGLLGGLRGLLDQLQKGGLGSNANSWVGSGPNQPVPPAQLGTALGPDIIPALSMDQREMNVWLHQQAMTKLAESGGQVPDSLKP